MGLHKWLNGKYITAVYDIIYIYIYIYIYALKTYIAKMTNKGNLVHEVD